VQNLETTLGYGSLVLQGISATVELTLLSCIVAFVMAIASGLGLIFRLRAIRYIARIYVEIFRGTSVFVQLFAAYFVLPLVGISLSPIQAGVLALGLNGGAYGAEVVRAAIETIGRDQNEATIALNLSKWQAMRHIIFPQAFLLMLPSFGNLSIEIMKGTAIASLISVSELTFQAQMVRSQSGETALPFTIIFFAYLVIASFLMFSVKFAERRFGRGMTDTNQGR
jgi:polar amino acid transport system permease protein